MRWSQGQFSADQAVIGKTLKGKKARFGREPRKSSQNDKQRPGLENAEDHSSAQQLGDESR